MTTFLTRFMAWGCVIGMPLCGAYLFGYAAGGRPWWAVLLGVAGVFYAGVLAGVVLMAAVAANATPPADGYDALDADDRRRLDLWLRR